MTRTAEMDEMTKALLAAGCTSPDGTVIHAPTAEVLAVLAAQSAAPVGEERQSAYSYEKAIREKVFRHDILTPGEWVFLVGLFHTAREHEDCLAAPPPSTPMVREETLKMVAGLFAESAHETYTREEVVSIVEDMIRLAAPDWKQDQAETARMKPKSGERL